MLGGVSYLGEPAKNNQIILAKINGTTLYIAPAERYQDTMTFCKLMLTSWDECYIVCMTSHTYTTHNQQNALSLDNLGRDNRLGMEQIIMQVTLDMHVACKQHFLQQGTTL